MILCVIIFFLRCVEILDEFYEDHDFWDYFRPTYLDNLKGWTNSHRKPLIPLTNNGLESFNSIIKAVYTERKLLKMDAFVKEMEHLLDDYSKTSKRVVFPIRYHIVNEMYDLAELIAKEDYFFKKNGKYYIEDRGIESKVLNNKTQKVYTNLNVSTFKDKFKKPSEAQVKRYLAFEEE